MWGGDNSLSEDTLSSRSDFDAHWIFLYKIYFASTTGFFFKMLSCRGYFLTQSSRGKVRSNIKQDSLAVTLGVDYVGNRV